MKKALVVLAVVLAIGGLGIYLAYNYVDVVVKLALERYGPEVAGVAVKVERVHISPRDGRGSLRGVEIGNPEGFSAPSAARVGEIRVALDPSTLADAVVVIHEIAIERPQITYERGTRATNLDVIQGHIDAYVKRAGGSPQAAGAGEERGRKRRFVIERLAIRGARVTMTNRALRGQGVGFDLPDVMLRDVGRRQNGVTASEAAALVASTLQNRIAQKVLTNVDALRRGGVEGAVDALRGLLK